MLKKTGIQINEKDNEGRTPLSYAASRNAVEIAKLLLKQAGIQVNEKDNEGRTPLDWAKMKNAYETAELLLNWKPKSEIS